MTHRASQADVEFRHSFESGGITPREFDHRSHLRLAYTYLVDRPTDDAYSAVRAALADFLARFEIDPLQYHDTLTRAWVMAVRHFMERTPPCASAEEFIERNPAILDSRIMMGHYTKERLFSSDARTQFVEPDREPIPRYDREG